jgi:hypothetical protein
MHRGLAGIALTALIGVAACADAEAPSQSLSLSGHRVALKEKEKDWDRTVEQNAKILFRDGKRIFRHDTFGSEAFWGDTLQLHKAILGVELGGVGPGVSPKTALAVGLKVDVEALPERVMDALRQGEVDLEDPAFTASLLQLDAVLGVKGRFNSGGAMTSIGITCAFCHSTVDDSFAPGIGRRLDGWPNRDLNVGAIVSLAPNLTPFENLLGVSRDTLTFVLRSWGPGRYDAVLNMDGKVFRPDGKLGTTVIPAAFGLAGQNLHTYTGWGSVPYWNAYVAVTQMHGQGTFYDPRLRDAAKFPLAQVTGAPDVRPAVDLVTAKLPALQHYQLALPAPKPPAGSFDPVAAKRGQTVFNGKARCASCHVPPLYSEPGWAMHTGAEIGIDDFQAQRSPDGRYRTTPLAGLFTRAKGGFYHDGRFADYTAVVDHYDAHFHLALSASERADLIEFLKSI